jgi:hypothetical protein
MIMTNRTNGSARGRWMIALLIFACAGIAHAQGSRKDDVVFNAQGRPMAGATVRVCTSSATGQPCSPLALIYSDAALTQALANPLSADGLGNYTFYAAPGRYEIEISGPGIITKQLPNVILPSDPTAPTFTTVTTTSGISAFSLSLTGNLTVSGSTAVSGTLTVGGAPVASTGVDNQWTANQRFGGPIPYRDFTKYMPPGGCSSTNTNDPPATGTIGSSSNTLTVSSAADFKTGCGIAVIGAGPMATLAMASTATGSTTRSGTLVTFTVTSGDPHLVPGIGNGGDFVGAVSVAGCSDTNFNTTTTGWLLDFGTPVTSFTYNTSGSGGTSATGCVATFYEGWAHGITGSTTWNYKIAAVDAHGGVSAAIGPIAVTNGNATLTPLNYNWVGWQATTGAREFAVYRDNGMGGAYTCINMAYSMGYSDWGFSLPSGCPAYVPATPPTSATAETLNTIITAGGGTTTLTLSASASNAATSQNVYNDVSMFLASCINDAIADQYPGSPSFRTYGSSGCFIPYGRWPMNADMPTDTIKEGSSGGVNVRVAGTLLFQSWPWMIGAGYAIKGEGFSGGALNGLSFPSTLVERGAKMPAGAIIRGTNVDLENFDFYNMNGHGIMLTTDPATWGSAAGVTLRNIASVELDGAGTGVPLLIDGNALFDNFYNMNLIPRTNGFPASILFTETQYAGNGHADIFFNNLYTQYHDVVIDSPAGQNSGQGTSFAVNGAWSSEDHGSYPTGGLIALDTGVSGGVPGAPSSSARLAGAVIENMQNADASNKYLVSMLGNQPTSAGPIILRGVDLFITQPLCQNGATVCAQGYAIPVITDAVEEPDGQNSYLGLAASTTGANTYLTRYPVLFGQAGFSPPLPDWANEIAAPYNLSVSGTGSGSLSAGTYCFVIVGTDSQSTPGYTMPSPEICQVVGASSSISLFWQLNRLNFLPNFRVYYGTSSGGENNYFTVAAANSTNQTYTLSTTSGSTSGTPPTTNAAGTAYSSWISDSVASCLLCVPSNAANHQLGVGEPSPPSGDELAVKGGVLDAESGFKSALATKSANYTLTTSDNWVNVTGTTTITVPHASTGNHWVVFNSGSNTVTVQSDSGNINGGASITLSANTGKEVVCDGSNCFAH